jgi:lipopolysaccharide transport protein LptA
MATTTNFGDSETWAGAFSGGTAAERVRKFNHARRHTYVVKALRFLLPGGAAGVVALYGLMFLSAGGWVDKPTLDLPRIIPENLTMDNPRYEGYTNDGGSYVVKAKTAIQDFSNTEFVRLNGITGDMVDANKSKTQLTAAHGDFNTKSNELELHGGIDIIADSGMRAKLSRATIITKDNVIFSKEPSIVELPSGKISSNELRVLTKSREIAFVDDVKAHLVPPENDKAKTEPGAAPLLGGGQGPIDISANRLDIDDTGKTATFTGNVVAQQGGAALATSSLEVHYEGGGAETTNTAASMAAGGGGTKISRIVSDAPIVMTRAPQDRVTGARFEFDAANEVAVVTGNVVMTSGTERHVTSNKATVSQRSDTILLTGGVVAKQGRNEMRGERLYVDRKSGRTELTAPGKDGRIETRFYRREEGAKSVKQTVEQVAASATSGLANVTNMFKTDPSAPIDVDATRLDVDDRAKVAIFRGDVRASQGDFVLRTSELKAHYSGSAGLSEDTGPGKKSAAEISRIEARGKVIVNSGENQKAVGDWANFDMKKNQVVVGGDVVLTQQKNVVRGTRLTIDMSTGEAVIHNDNSAWSATAAPASSEGPGFVVRKDGNRPSAIFYPSIKKGAKKKPSGGANSGSDATGSNQGWAPSN